MRIVGDDLDHHDEEWDDGDDDTVECPYCHRDVYEDAEQCPRCGKYLSHADRPWAPKPLWIVVGVGICLAVVYHWIFFVDLN